MAEPAMTGANAAPHVRGLAPCHHLARPRVELVTVVLAPMIPLTVSSGSRFEDAL